MGVVPAKISSIVSRKNVILALNTSSVDVVVLTLLHSLTKMKLLKLTRFR